MGSASLPTLRWGIVGTGLISSWFVKDLAIDRPDVNARHIIHAIGCSSFEKGTKFVAEHIPSISPAPIVHGSWDELYHDPDVDIVYLGIPHGMHKDACLAAIAAGKHVLCEKAFTITAAEAREVLAAADAKGVFIMEAMWTRFRPVVRSLQKHLYQDRVIGDVRRTFCDFGMEMPVASLGSESRLKNPNLGAGALLDVGIYSLTWGLLTLDPGVGSQAENPHVVTSMLLSDSIDVATSVILQYPSTGRQGILTCTTETKTGRAFCRIEGTKGFIVVEGITASTPSQYTIYPNPKSPMDVMNKSLDEGGEVHKFDNPGFGFYYEADAVAEDIVSGRRENDIMPHAETVRVMALMDEIRRRGGLRYPQDAE